MQKKSIAVGSPSGASEAFEMDCPWAVRLGQNLEYVQF